MDPQNKQTAAPAPSPAKPEPVTPAQANPGRPVAPWPPAGTPAAAEVAKQAETPRTPAPSPAEVQAVGLEVAEASGAIPTPDLSTPPQVGVPAPIAKPSETAQPMSDFVTVNAAKESVSQVPPAPPMTDQQADTLFEEEPATKKRNKHRKLKKVLFSLILILIAAALLGGGYIFYFGNKAATDFKNSSSLNTYKEALTKVRVSLTAEAVDSTSLKDAYKNLANVNQGSKPLSNVYLGNFNPNYKKAKQSSLLTTTYQAKVKTYEAKYGDSADLLKAIGDSTLLITQVEGLKSIDLTTSKVEEFNTKLTELLALCSDSSKGLESAARPEDLADSVKTLQTSLSLICTESPTSIEDGLAPQVTGKTGNLTAAEQADLQTNLNDLAQTATDLINGVGDSGFEVNKLTSFKRSALDEVDVLLTELEELLKK